jgi:two-component system nitrogen regulation response regulator GlnG
VHPGPPPSRKQPIPIAKKSLYVPTTIPEFLPEAIQHAPAKPADRPMAEVGTVGLEALIDALLQPGETNLYEKVMNAVERVLFTRALALTKGHQAQASQLLGLNRTTLRYKLRSLGLAVDKTVHDNAPRREPEA